MFKTNIYKKIEGERLHPFPHTENEITTKQKFVGSIYNFKKNQNHTAPQRLSGRKLCPESEPDINREKAQKERGALEEPAGTALICSGAQFHALNIQ